MQSNMRRTAMVVDEFGEEVGEETLERFGFTPEATQVWWDPATKRKFLHVDVSGDLNYFEPYDGPVVHGTGYSF